MRLLRDLGGLVVADLRIERGYQHERVVDMLPDIRLDGFESFGAMDIETVTAIADQPGAVQEIIDDHGFEDIELKVPHGSADVDGDVVAEHLCGDHGQRLALRGVDLAGHDR